MSIISKATGRFVKSAPWEKLLEQEGRIEKELRAERVLVIQDSLRVQLGLIREEIRRRSESGS